MSLNFCENMNIIYLHGFLSNSNSMKGLLLKAYIEQNTAHQIYLPDLNMPPKKVVAHVSDLIEKLENIALVGSSLGGFYATQLASNYHLPAVMINPAMQPWKLFNKLFGENQIPLKVSEQWTLTQAQLEDLEKMSIPFVQDASKLLVLLQQDDEVLDYREAQRYYSAVTHQSMLITETKGNHAMENFAEKIPMILQFLSDNIK
jgi:uncharacterized protein